MLVKISTREKVTKSYLMVIALFCFVFSFVYLYFPWESVIHVWFVNPNIKTDVWRKPIFMSWIVDVCNAVNLNNDINCVEITKTRSFLGFQQEIFDKKIFQAFRNYCFLITRLYVLTVRGLGIWWCVLTPDRIAVNVWLLSCMRLLSYDWMDNEFTFQITSKLRNSLASGIQGAFNDSKRLVWKVTSHS